MNTGRAIAFIASFTAAQALAGPLEYFYRADGSKVELHAEDSGDTLVIPVPGDPRPLRLERQIIVRIYQSLPGKPVLSGLGLEVVRPLGNRPHTWILRAENARGALRACARLVEEDLVAWAVPDFRVPVDLHFRPDDQFYGLQWHLAHTGEADISAEGAWDLTRGNPDVVVAILDTGVDPAHHDLDHTRMVNPRNVVTGEDDASPESDSLNAHGTGCAGLAVAVQNNAIGVSGVCPRCSWMPVVALEGITTDEMLSGIAEAFYWAADNGAWILSNSWGIGQEKIDAGFDITPLQDAVAYAVADGRGGKGCVVLFAAGNGDANLNALPIGPDELPAMPETIAVGGCDHNGNHAKYSDYGPYLSVVAPTWSGYPGDPKIITLDTSGDAGSNRGGEHWKFDRQDLRDVPTGELQPDEEGNYTAYFTGTSAATPIAAGVAALVLSVNPDLTFLEVMDILQSTAEKVGGVEYDQDGHHDEYGYGRVHAERAVAVARYGRNNPDGKLCRLDLNCENECLADPPVGEGPVCMTPCAATPECGDSRICHQGYCYPEFLLLLLVDDTCEPEPEIHGGCSHARGGALWFLWLSWLPFCRRFSPA